MVRVKYTFFVFCLCLLITTIDSIKSKQSTHTTRLRNVAEDHQETNRTDINIFNNVELVNHVSKVDSGWRWKPKSGALLVADEVKLQVLNSLEASLSLEFRVKVKKTTKMSIFRVISHSDDETVLTWLEILMDYQRSKLDVIYLSSSMVPERTVFDLMEPYNTWISFMITIIQDGDSFMSFSSVGWAKQERVLAGGVTITLPQTTRFEIGGRSSNADAAFTGFISKAMINLPGLSTLPTDFSDDKRRIQSRKGTERKPSFERNTRASSLNSITTSGRSIGNVTSSNSWREEIRTCLSEQQNLNNMLIMMKQSQTDLQNRIEYLEACECRILPCVTEDGRTFNHNQTWAEDQCVKCLCYRGTIQCQTDASCQRSPCDDVTCSNGGLCVETGSSYICRCRRGYYGAHCQEIDHCVRGVCRNGAECERLPNSDYNCICSDGYTGRNCQTRDWCFVSPCLNGASCINRARNFECLCVSGYSGDRCERKDWCFNSPCLNDGECINLEQRFRCRCPPGFVGDLCQYSDLCEANPCGDGGRCYNMLVSEDYRCDCIDGYTGTDCSVIDVCTSSPCFNRGVCIARDGSYMCRCPSGYVGDRCERRDACFAEPCMNGATCRKIGDAFECLCMAGFYGSICEHRDTCTSDSCRNGGVCVPGNGRFTCTCRRQFYGDRCQYIDYCRANPCRNGGNCRNVPLSTEQPYTCDCSPGYTGPLCQNADLCSSNPCLNRGVCSVEGRIYVCACPEPYRGDRCDLIDYCSRNPCLNGGVCRNGDRGFTCTCPQSHTGRRCENPHPCRNNPCRNGGKCRSDASGGYTCTCPSSHYGALCDQINHCYSSPCLNGGRCLNSETGFTCQCGSGFVGRDCSSTDGCATNPCLNGGRCRTDNGQVICQCPSTHQGSRCQYQCNICLYLPDQGLPCDASGQASNRRPEKLWYYDKFTQTCKSMRYAGCGGNSNRFSSRQECRQRCMVGACCSVQLSTPSVRSCRIRSMGQCKRVNVERNNIQVLSFKPGKPCAEDTCSISNVCKLGRHRYNPGDTVATRCERCMCLDEGVVDCPCRKTSIRKELRRFTKEELAAFQQAVRMLRADDVTTNENSWNILRDEYMQSAPVAQSSLYFLLWNRAFLKRMELLMQKVDCEVTIPFYDFTLDAGRFNESIVWQPDYFGGNGSCVPDHPYRVLQRGRAEPWQPCLVRNFNHDVAIPNMVDVALALTSRSLEELGGNLFSIISYVRAYIGGDMATSSAPYDPLFYPLHAYIDFLFAQWQEKHAEVQLPPYSDLLALGLVDRVVWSGACVSYVSMGYLNPCNVSNISPDRFNEEGYNLQGYNREGFNSQGFNREGYNAFGRDRYGRPDTRQLYAYDGYNAEGYNRSEVDRRGFNRYGFCNGFSKDGYNVAGYDRSGFNRYGFDMNGYNKRGFDIYGVSVRGRVDDSEFHDRDTGFSDLCFSREGLTVSGLDKYGFTASGYDIYNCNYFFEGPFAPYYQDKLWNALSIQPRTFLVTLSRTCQSLSNQPLDILEQNWLARAHQLPGLPVTQEWNTTFSDRFCLDTEMLLSWCPCLEGNYPAVCHLNPCLDASCPLHPGARCHINMCGSSCTAEFFLNGRRVNCEDPCRSNPCSNGGTCIPYQYSSAPDQFRCDCVNGFTGSLCERQSSDTCTLPRLAGSCQSRLRRWFYNQVTRSCEEFLYTGCGGNMNNFPHIRACELRCSVGACCYRKAANVSHPIGFDRSGYDKYGFNQVGYNRKGFHRSPLNSIPHGSQVLGPKGFGYDGYNIYGYNEEGYDRQGYDRLGFHRESGYNRTGYNKYGRFDGRYGYGYQGLNSSGFSRDGFLCNGLSATGYNHFGYYKEYTYNCQSLSQNQCDAMASTHEVIAFSIGQTCEDVHCGDKCGCDFVGKLYKFGEEFQHGCQTCTCTLAGTVNCLCNRLGKRKEIRDLTDAERELYTSAIQKLYESDNWDYFVNARSEYMPQAHGLHSSLPWHRFFLANIEGELQKHVGCKVSIPYFDWTIDVGSLNFSYVWSASYFGGNGQEVTNCVSHHPFQGSEKWSPCIQRRFDPSISLPDAVDVQLLLKEPNFKNFSIQLRAVSALFHLWVGGHMISPFSAYDPLFLSHWAFMDKLWADWQMKNPQGMPRFPLSHRYTQLKPFDITPDDVLSSQQQLCINYIPPTLGAPCNQTKMKPPLVRNEEGYDRNGFDNEGYDIDGYDTDGRKKNGERDNRNLYDDNGFTPMGYHRSGFDSQGWDMYGFNRMDKNRDGFDISGFDKSGYDRYGFDREGKTPFGMYRNGSFARGADEGYAASLFDSYGYNGYGFNPFGVDQKGYSAYGFNAKGYDQDACNYYNEGPHYMRFFFFGLMQLQNLPRESLMRINRICSGISPLPDVTVSQWWLGDMELIRDFERQWAANRQINSNFDARTSSVTDDRLWLPLTPDQQFCFDLHKFTGCPVATPLVDCPTNLCQLSRCASHPTAQCRNKNCGSCYAEFYDGNTGDVFTCFGCVDSAGVVRGEASSWEENCQSCLCQGGTITCTPVMCPSIRCSDPASSPGQCCPSCSACEYEGSIYRNGQRFENSRCEACQCNHGSVTCDSSTQCPEVDCPNPIRRPGECCSTCPSGCEGHREGETWSMGDCRSCQCVRGVMRCFNNRCPVPPCSHPHKPPSSCCPLCNDCQYNGRRISNRRQFTTDTCTQCTCTDGNIACSRRACPPLQCLDQEHAEGQCCPVCVPGCQFEGNTYRNGETFRPLSSSCRNCTCQDNEVVCRGRQCRSVGTCPRPSMGRQQCCPDCTDCTYGDRRYRNHQVWTSEDGCQRCTCEDGNIDCEVMYACDDVCTHGITLPGHCCKECSRCSYNSQTYEDGELLSDERNPCNRCQCSRGNITCSTLPCPPLRCSSQSTKLGDCCPFCSSCRQGSVEREHGSSWRMNRDACTTCSCNEGKVNCRTEQCPSNLCDYPLSGTDTCCPTCDGCTYNGANYRNGEKISMTEPCRKCKCENGNIACERQRCEEVSCQNPVTPPGRCCPSCATCTYEQQTYDEGATFISPRNPCLQCTCESGEVSCTRLDLSCPDPGCGHPGREYGVCCPNCNNCAYERRNYRNGETFTPTGSSPCLKCTCTDGSVRCATDTCEGVSCPNPVTLPGQCCPTCQVCEAGGMTYESGDQWMSDRCTTCTCDTGRAVCQSMDCPTLPCTHPAQTSDSCCQSCDSCMTSGHVFSHGQTFRHPSESCQLCQCDTGNINCRPVECETPSCSSPVTIAGECCPVCTNQCVVNNDLTVDNGMTIVHPNNSCQTCVCTGGNLKCDRRCQLDPPCRHPTDGECCRDNCDGCYYKGNKYYNGQEFPHSRDKCRRCTCRNGNVRCLRHRCPALPCDNPRIDDNLCCPVCPTVSRSCTYGSRSVADGQQFQDGCQLCRCVNGATECQAKSCPRASCRYPSRKECCRECTDCTIDGVDYSHGDVVPSEISCLSCRCMSGNLVCSERSCPPVSCTHPGNDSCCSSCQACSYGGRTYSDGDRFPSIEQTCGTCTCTEGSVICERKHCPQSNCTHPIRRARDANFQPTVRTEMVSFRTIESECCPLCGGDCLYDGSIHIDGSTFPKLDDSCRISACMKGSVVSQSKPCAAVSCRNPSTDRCGCATCDDCIYNGVQRRNRETFSSPQDQHCSQCYCQNGNVNCERKRCPSPTCTHPTQDTCNCPGCDACFYHGRTYTSGQEFMDVEDTCNNCICEDGNAVCESRSCPESECLNPVLDRCGCPGCGGCNYLAVEYDNNENFIDSMNKCNQCVCRFGTVQCAHRPCPPVFCPNPATAFGECCPKCIGSCLVEGESFENGATFRPPSDPCSSCTCTSGDVRCIQTRCDRSCTHPIRRDQCCPDCTACLYQGRSLESGEGFTPRNSPCQHCTCLRGNVVCREMQCPVPDCPNPRVVRGQCCPECTLAFQQSCHVNGRSRDSGERWVRRGEDSCSECACSEEGESTCTDVICDEDCSHPVPVISRCCKPCTSCYYLNHTYNEGEIFHPNSCQDCFCRRGNVQCITKACEPLSCPLYQQIQSHNDCCPRCVSCVMGQHAFAEGETWTSSDDVCVTCQCVQGVITCQPVTCIPACQMMSSVPGLCCPVCPGCRHGTEVYNIGDHFEPNPMNPCEICECIASSSGSPSLICHQVACPSLADCPRSCIKQAEPGTCCPTCTNRPECSYGHCNSANRGQRLFSPENPCVSCSCNANDTWECAPLSCPKLDCPQEDRYTPKGSCCPLCDHCVIAAEDRRVENGHLWRITTCRSCHCDYGAIVCTDQECQALQCPPPMVLHKAEDQCCEQCVDPHASCIYEGHTLPSQHRWLVDKCTNCQCFAGKITCATQRCRMLMCNSDETATVLPGECCPRCLPSPGTCVAYGDPHYRTYDGRMIHFQGRCRYILTSDCLKGDFRVEVENKKLDNSYGDVSWTDQVYLTMSNHRVQLGSNYDVTINGTTVQPPILVQPYLFIDRTTNHLLVNTQIGVQLMWNAAQRHLVVSVPGTYKQRTCGLCGNFNNYPQDDLRLRNSRMTTSDTTFGNHWKVVRRNLPACPDALAYNPCDNLPYPMRKKANTACKILRSETFSSCHQVVNPDMYFASCLQDVCACGENNKFCLCDALEAYAAECRRTGVTLSWRSSTLCALTCPTQRGYVFDECGSPCKRTCANRNLPPEEIDRQCYMPCVSGCQCVAGKVEHEGRCIDPRLCPDHIKAVDASVVHS